jgi:nucleoside-diphosphate-sugar epimerase
VRLQSVRGEIDYLKADITNWSWVSEKYKPFDSIFHLAAFAMPAAAQKQPELAFRQNVMGTANMLEIARRCSLRKFIFLSAGALYTNIPKYLPIDEKHPIDPCQSVYATTKRIGELLCEDFQKNYGVSYIYFRLFNTYGPRQSEEYLIPSFIKQARAGKDLVVLNEKVKRDFSYVDDIADALIKGAESEYQGGPINLGTGIEHSIGEVARKIANLFGVKVSNLDQEVFGAKRQVCDNTRAKRILGWQPSYSLDEGIEMTVRSFQ